MQKSGDLKYTIVISLLIHLLLLLWLSSLNIKASAGKTVYLTEETTKIRKENPIGMDETALKSASGLIEGPSFGGGYGEDNLPPGSLDGKTGIEGPIASRGVLYSPPALYPEWARRKGIEGEIKAQIKVDPKGDVKDTIVIKTSGFKELDQVVIECMRKWKFAPLPFSANQTDQDGRITFKFNLKK